MQSNDIDIPVNSLSKILIEKHISFIEGYGKHHDSEAYSMSDYLRVSGMYWAATSLQILKYCQNEISKSTTEEMVSVVLNDCFDRDVGGFRPWVNHEPHLLFTLSAIQLLASVGSLKLLTKENKNSIIAFIQSLQQNDGSFAGDRWGEVDSRFSFCAVATLALLNADLQSTIRLKEAIDFVKRCQNFDGGFGLRPSSESHAGNIFCCLGFLSLVNRLDVIEDVDTLGWWLCERQLPNSGGLNGRPEKLPDVCYSWWVLSSLSIINRLHWIDVNRLAKFILASQDEETGGFSDRPGFAPDPFHTLFGLAGLSLTQKYQDQLETVNPVLCMTQNVVDSLGIKTPVIRF